MYVPFKSKDVHRRVSLLPTCEGVKRCGLVGLENLEVRRPGRFKLQLRPSENLQ